MRLRGPLRRVPPHHPAPQLEPHGSGWGLFVRAVRDYLKASEGRYMPSGEVADAMEQKYGWKKASTRSICERGWYRFVPTNADSPAVSAGLSVLTVPTTEGGDDSAADPGDRDNQLPGWNDRDGHHPSVMEG